jgi:hypothetical protein
MRGSICALGAAFALVTGCSAQARSDLSSISGLWSEYVAACHRPATQWDNTAEIAGWSDHQPPSSSYIAQHLAGTEKAMQVGRNAGDIPQDLQIKLETKVFKKIDEEQDVYLVVMRAPVPDGSGRVLASCSLVSPNYRSTLSEAELAGLAGSQPRNLSNRVMDKFGWEPGLSTGQIKTEIISVRPEGEKALKQLGMVGRGLTIRSQSLEGST